MVKLKRLKILKYRNVRPGTELRFDDGVNLVLGQNGSGKTTLLGLIAAAAGSDFATMQSEEFYIEYDLEGYDVRTSISLKNSLATVTPGAPPEAIYHYRVIITSTGGDALCQVEGTPTETSVYEVAQGSQVKTTPRSPFARGFIASTLMLQHVAGHAQKAVLLLPPTTEPPRRFDESLNSFLSMTGRIPTLPGPGTASRSEIAFSFRPHETGYQAEFFRREYFPDIFAALALAIRDNQRGIQLPWVPPEDFRAVVLDVPRDHLNGEWRALVLLSEAIKILGFTSATVEPEVRQERFDSASGAHLFHITGVTFHSKRHDGTVVHHDLLSYGQKRLLAFFYYLATIEHFVIADELVNGLHHRWIEACMRAIGDRQAFLTSQNPLLFEYVDFDSVEQVQARFVTCRTELVDGAEQLVWENMSRDDATRFYEGYQAEIEGIGDILINRGLW